PDGCQDSGARRGGAVEAATVIQPALGVQRRLCRPRASAGQDLGEAIDDDAVPGLRLGGIVAQLDRAIANQPGKLADRFEHRPATGAKVADQTVRTCRAIEAGLAGHTFEVGHARRLSVALPTNSSMTFQT